MRRCRCYEDKELKLEDVQDVEAPHTLVERQIRLDTSISPI